MKLPNEWKEFLIEYLKTPAARELYARVDREYASGRICPPKELLFSAFNYFLPRETRVVILGQDPYHGGGQATGMSFSINPEALRGGVKFPPSLTNIITEIKTETGKCAVENGDLIPWARQGVLLLNTCLTVKAGMPLSHAEIGWSGFTNAVIQNLDKIGGENGGIVFILWGSNAQKFRPFITNPANLVLTSAHPSPLSAHNGFFGCGHFIKTNMFLKKIGAREIDW
jgi:uracil-DNA glycosylase